MSDESEGSEDQTRRITLGKIIAYPVGILLLMAALGGFIQGQFLGGILILLGGIIALPIFRGRLSQNHNISLSRWATVVIVIVLVIGGGALLDPNASSPNSSNNDPGDSSGTDTPNLIEGPPETLLPTIEEFEPGWTANDDEAPNEATFYNVDTETLLIYNISIHDSVGDAQTELENRQPENRATDDVSVGDEGFLYKFDEQTVIIQFRIRNVVAKVEFLGGPGVLTPETNAENFAERLADSITG
jgi:hypothetical protein